MPISDNAATFLGINNENEFYSAHYLAEVFNGDIKNILGGWKEKETTVENFRAPNNRLRSMANDYFLMRERSQKERNAKKAIAMQRAFFKQFCSVLDIPWAPQNIRVTTDKKNLDTELPVLSILPNADKPMLWVIGVLDGNKEGTDPLLLELSKEQFIGDGPQADSLAGTSWYELLNDVIFKQDQPPRWVLLLSDRQSLLIDRYKWLQNRLLRFDLDEILGRKDDVTLKATAALLHRESLAPENGDSLLDNLDENSHKHAFGVSEDLKYALREAIELLGNEASEQLIQRNEISFTGKSALDAEALSRECLRYMYRLLFLFYIEARPELKYVPSDSPAYRKGYSLETLRDLELVKLTTEESRKGSYIHQSLNMLFKLIHTGYNGTRDDQLADSWKVKGNNSFSLEKLDSHLFDPKQTPYLNKVTFSNQTLKTIIELMSLTREKTGRGRTWRGRVSYAQLGINQLGAVYEALLSYRGFFAVHDLYEVKKAGDKYNELDTGYFVPAAEIEQYQDAEKFFPIGENGQKVLKMHPKGKFIYRLAGRDREKSASFYTPEVLTQCVVKYTLKERLKGLTADDILKLSMCEPAMGSAAFLNESINQLSEAYLTLKQQELGIRIPHEEYREALQKVKMYIADHNVYGVDLNPIATELAEISLWLNALSKSSAVPWFGYQLFNGNSLIGARRQVYAASLLSAKTKTGNWHSCEPKRLDPQNPKRDNQEIYHFLVPDPGMVGLNDTEAKKLKPKAFEAIKKWKTPFLKPLDADEITLLEQLSNAIDELWKEHTDMLRIHRRQTEDEFPIWGQKTKPYHTTTAQKDQIRASGIFNNNAKIASAYRRLKLAMDYWCALWFWPTDQVDLLPERSDWLFELNLILRGQVFSFQVAEPELSFEATFSSELLPSVGQQALFETDHQQLTLTTQERKAQSVKTAKGEINLEKLLIQFPRLKLVDKLAKQYKFFHWELTFADLFKDKGGFDILLGNPPWSAISLNVEKIIGDFSPSLVIQNLSVQAKQELISNRLEDETIRSEYFSEAETISGTRSFLSSSAYFPYSSGMKCDLYKSFSDRQFSLLSKKGVSGLLHQNSIFEEENGNIMREKYYSHLIKHFSFVNQEKLFPIGNTRSYSINVLAMSRERKYADLIFGLYHPSTIGQCFSSDEYKELGKKDLNNNWNKEGCKSRIICLDEGYLSFVSELFEEGRYKKSARLVSFRSKQEVDVLKRLVSYDSKAVVWESDEATTNSIQFIKKTSFVELSEFVLQSAHISLGGAFSQTPNVICNTHRAYKKIDFDFTPEDYLPRSNYKTDKDYTDLKSSRVVARRRVDKEGERTILAGWSPAVAQLEGVVYFDSGNNEINLIWAGVLSSLPYDYFQRVIGKPDFRLNALKKLPPLHYSKCQGLEIQSRSMIIFSSSNIFTELWSNVFDEVIREHKWTSKSGILNNNFFTNLNSKWSSNSFLRNEFDRRQALLEIDVIVAFSLQLHVDELISLYHVQFPVMRQYEKETYYDINGHIIFTPSKGLVGVGLSRKTDKKDQPVVIEYPDGRTETKPLGWEDICPESAPSTKDGRRENYASGQSYGKPKIPDGTKIRRTVIDDTLPGGPREKTITYIAPFYLPDREEDYRVAWDVFSKRFKTDEDDA